MTDLDRIQIDAAFDAYSKAIDHHGDIVEAGLDPTIEREARKAMQRAEAIYIFSYRHLLGADGLINA